MYLVLAGYVDVCVAFKSCSYEFSYSWRVVPSIYRGITNFEDIDCFSENYYVCEVLCSSSFLKELFELIKLILWRSNNQTYHLDS
jgi:hypothetical protein